MTIGMRGPYVRQCSGDRALLALPASGLARIPPEDDGSTYTWPGATTLTVDVTPWGGATFEARRT